jgi:hypothetical protein
MDRPRRGTRERTVEPATRRRDADAGGRGLRPDSHQAHPIRAITEVRADLTAFANRLDVDGLQDDRWAVYGALLVNLRNVLDALDLVAEAQPVKVPAPAISA